jgi:NADH-quinone oxidoreductase subunit G
MEAKNHKEEQQWSPVVFFDRPRCILCYRCVRVCGEGMDVWALGVQNRGVSSLIAPNKEDHLECEECGMCIDICPVGALTSGAYRYKTRPWEMKHVGTVCTHCGDGCKTTLGVRRSDTGMEIVRGDNRDKSGTNGDFLCIKGRYAFDFANHEERLTQPLIRKNGKLTPSTWKEAFDLVGKKFAEVRDKDKDKDSGSAIGVIGSTRTTNEEAYLLSKFARVVLQTNNIDHHRTADFPALSAALRGKPNATASMADVYNAPAILLIGNDPTEQHPLLAWQIRNNVRLRRAKLYVINFKLIKLQRQATSYTQIPADAESKVASFLAGDDSAVDAINSATTNKDAWIGLRDQLRAEQNLIIIFGSEIRGTDVSSLVTFGSAIPGAKFICLADYANSRGAADMGLYPDLLPGYHPTAGNSDFHKEWAVPQTTGFDLPGMVEAGKAGKLKALYVVGSNPVGRLNLDPFAFSKSFVVVQDMFLTETAVMADVVLPAANAYEKSGTMTNTCGDVQLVKKAGEISGSKTDFEMIVRIADAMGFDIRKLVPFGGGTRADMGESRGAQSGEADRHAVWLEMQGLETKLSPLDPMAILDEIQRLVPGYDVSRINLLAGNSEHTALTNSGHGVTQNPELISPANDGLFTSGTLGRYSRTLKSVMESHEVKSAEVAAD